MQLSLVKLLFELRKGFILKVFMRQKAVIQGFEIGLWQRGSSQD